eukprot:PhF_6_TR27833/c0_g1_i1/m.40611
MYDVTVCTSANGTEPETTATILVQTDVMNVLWQCVRGKGVIRKRLVHHASFEVLGVIALPECTCIIQCDETIWIGTTMGSLHVYDKLGTMVTAVQCTQHATDGVEQLYSHHHGLVHSIGRNGTCVVEWNAETFSVRRVYALHRSVVLTLVYTKTPTMLFVATDISVSVWRDMESEHASLEIADHARSMLFTSNALWCASTKAPGINVWVLSPQQTFVHVKCLSTGAMVVHITVVGKKVWAFNVNRTIVVWDPESLQPIRKFPCPTLLMSPSSKFSVFMGGEYELSYVWLCCSEETIKWSAQYDHDRQRALPDNSKGEDSLSATQNISNLNSVEEAKEECIYYKRKLKYLQSVGTIFRQRIGMLLKGHLHGSALADFENADILYRNALGGEAGLLGMSSVVRGASVISNEADVRSDVGVHPVEDPIMMSLPRSRADGSPPQGGHMVHTPRLGSTTPNKTSTPHGALTHPAMQEFAANDHIAQFWRDKYRSAQQAMERASQENDRLNQLLHEAGGSGSQREVDIRRAQHVCELVKERTHLKQRNSALMEEVRRLRSRLQSIDSTFIDVQGDVFGDEFQNAGFPPGSSHTPLADETIGQHQTNERLVELEDDVKNLSTMLERSEANNKALQKQLALMQTRLKNSKEDLTKQMEVHAGSTFEMQRHVEALVKTIATLKAEITTSTSQMSKDKEEKSNLTAEIKSLREAMDKMKTKLFSTERDLEQHSRVQTAVESEAKREIQTLCTTLEDRDKRIVDLQDAFLKVSAQLQDKIRSLHDSAVEREAHTSEIQHLRRQVKQLKAHFEERRLFASLLAEVQGRMELSVEELRRAQRTEDLALAMEKMEHRISGLTALESQLSQKDDIIALKDDEIQRLAMHLAVFEKNVNQISAVFLRFPHNIDDMERLLIEHEEYKRCIGDNPEINEAIAIRVLETQAKRSVALQADNAEDHSALAISALNGGGGNGPSNPSDLQFLHNQTAALLARINRLDHDDE